MEYGSDSPTPGVLLQKQEEISNNRPFLNSGWAQPGRVHDPRYLNVSPPAPVIPPTMAHGNYNSQLCPPMDSGNDEVYRIQHSASTKTHENAQNTLPIPDSDEHLHPYRPRPTWGEDYVNDDLLLPNIKMPVSIPEDSYKTPGLIPDHDLHYDIKNLPADIVEGESSSSSINKTIILFDSLLSLNHVPESKPSVNGSFRNCLGFPPKALAHHTKIIAKTWPQLTSQAIEQFPKFCSLFDEIKAMSCPNFIGARRPLDSALNIPAWRHYLADYHDKLLCEYLEFGWPLGYHKDEPPQTTNGNHPSAIAHSQHVDKFIKVELNHAAILGPF